MGKAIERQEIRNHFPDLIKKIQINMISFINYVAESDSPNSNLINKGLRFSVELLGKIGFIDEHRKAVESLFKLIDDEFTFVTIRFAIFTSLGKFPPDSEIIEKLMKNFDEKTSKTKSNFPSLLWAIGKQSSRDANNPVLIDYIENITEKLFELIDTSEDYEITQYSAYALMEVVSKNINDPLNQVSDDLRKQGILKIQNKIDSLKKIVNRNSNLDLNKRLNELTRYNHTLKMLKLAIKKISGFELTTEEKEVLLSIRKKITS